MPRLPPLTAEDQRAVEALAQMLYERSDPIGAAWARRGPTVREPWLQLARKQLSGTEQ